jgi:hypothetical protein
MTDRAPFAIKFAVPFAASPLNSSLLVIQLPLLPRSIACKSRKMSRVLRLLNACWPEGG